MKRFFTLLFLGLGLLHTNFFAPALAAGDSQPQNMVLWFEIPVTDMGRAVQFYNTIFAIQLRLENTGVPMAFFPPESENLVSGALIQMDTVTPGPTGPIVYLNGGADLQVILDRVEAAGGKILVGKTLISEQIGYFGIFLDTEGNRLGLFSPAKR